LDHDRRATVIIIFVAIGAGMLAAAEIFYLLIRLLC
jgi:hypothetical protein